MHNSDWLEINLCLILQTCVRTQLLCNGARISINFSTYFNVFILKLEKRGWVVLFDKCVTFIHPWWTWYQRKKKGDILINFEDLLYCKMRIGSLSFSPSIIFFFMDTPCIILPSQIRLNHEHRGSGNQQ